MKFIKQFFDQLTDQPIDQQNDYPLVSDETRPVCPLRNITTTCLPTTLNTPTNITTGVIRWF